MSEGQDILYHNVATETDHTVVAGSRAGDEADEHSKRAGARARKNHFETHSRRARKYAAQSPIRRRKEKKEGWRRA